MGKPLHRRVVPETYVQLLFEYLDGRSINPEALLKCPWPVPDPHGLGGVPVQRWQELLESAQQQLGEPDFGLNVGRTISTRHLGILGPVILACGNLAQALERWERYQRLIFDVVPLTVRVQADTFELSWDAGGAPAGRLVEEVGMVVTVQMVRSLARGSFSPQFVGFSQLVPPHADALQQYFGCEVLFGQPIASIRSRSELLTRPLRSPDPALIAVLEKHADELLAQLPQEEEIVAQVRRHISHLIRDGEPDVEHVSAKMHCSARTLRRRLAETGTNFRRELNVVRHEMANTYLKDPRLQVVDVALLLGYSEHSAFTRAYREWTGRTPQEQRAHNRIR